jgi:hypothetical protein
MNSTYSKYLFNFGQKIWDRRDAIGNLLGTWGTNLGISSLTIGNGNPFATIWKKKSIPNQNSLNRSFLSKFSGGPVFIFIFQIFDGTEIVHKMI